MSKKQIDINISRKIYNKAYLPYLDDDTSTQIFFGGSSSGKSVFLAQRCIRDILKGGRNYLCIRNTKNTIDISVFTELKKVINKWNLSSFFHINNGPHKITCRNRYQILFAGLDDPEKLKSITPENGVITDIWIEEATETNKDSIKLLEKRLRGMAGGIIKRIILSFNPIIKSHWIYKLFFKNFTDDATEYRDEYLSILKTTYKDNRFLDAIDIHRLENEEDEYLYSVYTLGNWGVLGDVIFKNWETRDIRNDPIFNTFDIFKSGLDFGFTNDPTSYNRSYYHRASKTLYIFDEWTARGVTNDQIAEAIKPRMNGDCVVCDSSEPKSIQELCNYGVNAVGAQKGKDSVNFGIQWLKQQKIVIDKTCQNVKNEFEQYHWKKNKEGEVLNVPVDKYNHHIDALRYAYEDEMAMIEDTIIVGGQTLATQGYWG